MTSPFQTINIGNNVLGTAANNAPEGTQIPGGANGLTVLNPNTFSVIIGTDEYFQNNTLTLPAGDSISLPPLNAYWVLASQPGTLTVLDGAHIYNGPHVIVDSISTNVAIANSIDAVNIVGGTIPLDVLSYGGWESVSVSVPATGSVTLLTNHTVIDSVYHVGTARLHRWGIVLANGSGLTPFGNIGISDRNGPLDTQYTPSTITNHQAGGWDLNGLIGYGDIEVTNANTNALGIWLRYDIINNVSIG